MSSDNIVLIKKTDDVYKGYDISINCENKLDDIDYEFCVNTIEEAIIESQKINAEYGYKFINLCAPKTRKIKIEAVLILNEEKWDVNSVIKGNNINNLDFNSSEYREIKITEI